MSSARTRIAPSPTGDMHLGTARCAYFNWLFARGQEDGGEFILRIDDTDREREKEGSVHVIHKTIEWLGLGYDEVHYQSSRLSQYTLAANALVGAGLASTLENGAIALNQAVSELLPKSWYDAVNHKEIPITPTNHEQIIDKVILCRGGDKLGEPTYQMASAFDDIDLAITDVIRGVDHISNTPKQIAIMLALREAGLVPRDRAIPTFHHVGLITHKKKKLSKRDAASSMLSYFEDGYNPEALLAYMLRLGWGPKKDNKENAILPRDRAVGMFLTEGRMRQSPAEFDQAKLDWMQKSLS